MASQYPPKKNTAFTLYFTLYKNDGTVIANPGTIVKKVSIDGGAVADIAASVTEEDTTYGQCSLVIAQAEMNGDAIWIYIKDDTAGCVPFTCTLYTTANTQDEIGADVAAVHVHVGTIDGHITADYGSTEKAAIDLLDDADGGLADLHTVLNNLHDTDLPAIAAYLDTEIAAILEDTGTTLPGTLSTIAGYLDTEIQAIIDAVAKIPKSDGTVSLNATVLAAIQNGLATAAALAAAKAVIDNIHDTDLPAVKAVVDTIQADTDLLDDVGGGLADIHTDVASARSEISAVKTVVDGIEVHVHTTIPGTISTMQGNITDILADTNELQLEFVDGGRLDLLIDQILADTNELQVDNVNGGRTDLLIDSIITKVDALAFANVGLGACTWAYTLTDSVTMLPIEGVEVWVTTDLAGTNMVAHGFTNASGVVTFLLDAGTNYFWRQHGNYTFTNPDTEIVS